MSGATGVGTDRAGPESGHLLPLDGIRGLAVLIVIIHNAAWIAGSSEQLLLKATISLTASGWIGVQLFFALSGFLITGILLDTKGTPRYFRSFYLRRTLRIFPLYYTFLALTVFVAPLVAWSPEWVASVRLNQWPYWVYLSNWTEPFKHGIHGLSHLWSLAVEEQFYLVWPLVVWLIARRGLVWLSLAMIIGTPFIRLGIRLTDLPLEAAYMFTVARWDALAAGALVAALLRDEQGRALVRRWQGRITVAAVVALAALVLRQHGFHSEDIPDQVIGQSLVAILSATLLAYAAVSTSPLPSRLQSALSRPGLRTLGKYSYAMYVFHFPIHHSLKLLLADVVMGADTPMRLVRLIGYLVLVITLTFIAALISWRVIEKPFLDLKNRVAPRAA